MYLATGNRVYGSLGQSADDPAKNSEDEHHGVNRFIVLPVPYLPHGLSIAAEDEFFFVVTLNVRGDSMTTLSSKRIGMP